MITFANRVKDLGTRILEALEYGTILKAFRESTLRNVTDCFQKELKPEIEQRLHIEDQEAITSVVHRAISIERRLANQRSIREKTPNDNIYPTARKKVFACSICKVPDDILCTCGIEPITECQFCHQPGHTLERCVFHAQALQGPRLNCQLCKEEGHTASTCKWAERCQLCDKVGHAAKDCASSSRLWSTNTITCQSCRKLGHSAKDCYSLRPRVNPGQPSTRNYSQLTGQICQRAGHSVQTCYFRNNRDKPPDQINAANMVRCQLCQRVGHTATGCQAQSRNNQAECRY